MNSFLKLPHTAALLGGFVLGTLAIAAGTKSPTALSEFASMDANKDGKVTADEHSSAARKMFEMMDADKDGALTKAEFDAGHAAMLKKPPR